MLVKTKLKYIQTLGQKKFRDADAVFIAEGPKVVAEFLLAQPPVVKEIFATKQWIDTQVNTSKLIPITEITEQELERISQLATPNKVLAVVAKSVHRSALPAKGK